MKPEDRTPSVLDVGGEAGGFGWAPYGNVAVEVYGPDGQTVCLVGLPSEKRLSLIREDWYRRDRHVEAEERRILEGRDANVAWAKRIAAALAEPLPEQRSLFGPPIQRKP